MSDSGTTTADDAAWWRLWATRHGVAAAVLGGVIAAHVATIFGYWFPGVGLPRLDWNTANGWVYVPFGTPLEKFAVGGLFHYLDGIIFAVALHPVLPWRNTVLGNLAKGRLRHPARHHERRLRDPAHLRPRPRHRPRHPEPGPRMEVHPRGIRLALGVRPSPGPHLQPPALTDHHGRGPAGGTRP
ncbi:hypothetical protein ACKI1Q_33720 [Streptomyces galilaeus]|uniref:hypothetical protein n=1 Tax=Streptomyces galilaeus TaxID=33899 RepID=UPI0038F66BBC